MSEPINFADPRVKEDAAEAGMIGGAQPTRILPEAKNYAEDQFTRNVVIADILPVIDQCRQDRATLEEEWKAIRRMETLTHDEGRRYLGRSAAYLPVWQKGLNTLVSNLGRGLFPSDDYMDVYSPDQAMSQQADAIKQYLEYEFEAMARVRINIKPGLRQLVSFGTMPIKHVYVTPKKNIGFAKKATLLGSGGGLAYGYEQKTYCEGLRISARDLFNWYIYPSTAASLDEAQMVFETIDIGRDFLQQQRDSGRWNKEACDHLLASGPNIDNDHNLQANEKLSRFQGGGASEPGKNVREFGAVYTVTEIWTFLRLPSSAYLETDYKDQPLPVRITMCDEFVLEVRRNPHFHQRPPYEVGRMNVQPGFFYGSGFGRVVRHPQYLANDFANQTNDCGIYALNPVLKVNQGMMTAPITPIRPGAVWYMNDPNAVVFDRPPIEQVGFGLQMMSTYIGMSQDFGGAPPILQGVGAGRAGKTATQAQILQKNANIPLQDIIEDLEGDVLVPLMRAAWMNGLQYRDKPVMAIISGRPVQITPEMLALPDAQFRWLASSQAMNQQMRSQQAMQFLQAVLPVIPLLMQTGQTFDPTPLLRRIYTDGLGFRDFDNVIKPMNPMMAMQAQMAANGGQQEGGPPAPGAPGGVRSPVDQAEGSPEQGADMPDDSGDFMAVRGESEEMAAMMGAGGGSIE